MVAQLFVHFYLDCVHFSPYLLPLNLLDIDECLQNENLNQSYCLVMWLIIVDFFVCSFLCLFVVQLC